MTRINNAIEKIIQHPKVYAFSSLLMRLMISVIFILSGLGKIFQYSSNAGYMESMESMGVSSALLPLAILVEFGGGFLVLIGLQTRLAAFLLFGFSLVAAVLFHSGSDMNSQIMFMKNISMAGGLLALVIFGAGGLSVDKKLK
ncbi:DoxX family protein [Acinetobacter baumannii]|nr:DoxX family protein [Acinetobacter baumannii]EHT1071381.1 DoxX family protein [Acinetobacter baumannii]EKV7755571.1 DoxX family protein [Acinetobacter baumannii]EKW7505875.1 DoxX family protein [Acinetobacter baumannii]EKW8716508.1 DoxX family protein [Acinetobacter baumannii]ELB7301793.1 DoxX family protein [Acinetobacter baumannii]